MRAVWLIILALFGNPANAGTLDEVVLKTLQADPQPFLSLATDLIHGFGTAGGIDAVGVGQFVALERAEARASALRRLLVADLDFDGAVTRAEMAVLAAASSAKGRGRLWRLFDGADGNGSGVIDAAEQASFGLVEAMRGFSAEDEALARSILTFDGNADGKVTLAEVQQALAALGI